MIQDAKILPHSPELEKSVLAIILDNGRDKLEEVIDLLPEVGMFYISKNQILYAAILHLYKIGYQCDLISVLNELTKTGNLV